MTYLYYSVFGDKVKKLQSIWQPRVIDDGKPCHLVCELDRRAIDWTKDLPFKLRIAFGDALWTSEQQPIRTLGKNNVSPGDYGFVLPEKSDLSKDL